MYLSKMCVFLWLYFCFLSAYSIELPVSQNSNSDIISEKPKESCIVIGESGDVYYDLSSLSSRDHWIYSESAHNKSTLKFAMSLCHPIRGLPGRLQGPLCNSSEDGVCFMYNEEGKSFDTSQLISSGMLDSRNKQPTLIQEGALKYLFENGSKCRIGDQDFHYKTELHLQCPFSIEEETPGPILMSSPQCVFIFVWMTNAACPKTVKSNVNDSCILTYSGSNTTLNLHSLSNSIFYKLHSIHSSYELNVCSGIKGGSCLDKDVAVCDTSDPLKPIALSYTGDYKFAWKNDYLHMSFGKTKNSTNVEYQFYCDRTDISPRIYHLISDDLKMHIFKIYTINVCTPKPLDCVIEDGFYNIYDLRPLRLEDKNWDIIGKNYNYDSSLFHINMCAPVNSLPDNPYKCPEGIIGACQTSINAAGAKNLGFITSVPKVNEDKSITVTYTGGDPCRKGAKSSSTRITLFCSNNQYPPTFMDISESCEHIFEWHTPAACPVHVVTGEDCIVTDPLFGHVYNLNPLRNKTHDYHAEDEKTNYTLNVCGPLVKQCEDSNSNASVCQLGDKPQSLGATPGELIFNDGTLIMKFHNGSKCNRNTERWTSQLLLLCGHEEDGPHYIHPDELACVHHFIWYTRLACPPHNIVEKCSVKDGDNFYDLTPLSDPANNQIFITYDSNKKFVLNVCRSVVHSKESRCAYNAGACLIDLSHKNQSKNLGVVNSGPYLEAGNLRLKYENGDSCNSTHNFTTIINFECSPDPFSSYPTPIAEEVCLIEFSWKSPYACPQKLTSHKEEEKEGNCTAINPQTKFVFDMNDLRSKSSFDLRIGMGVNLLVSACGKIEDSRCSEDNSGACMVYSNGDSKSGGKSNKKLQFHMWSTYLEYEGGSVCSNGIQRSTKISFICQEEESPSGPVFIANDETSCTFFINWYTHSACERHIQCFAHSVNLMYDLTPLAKVRGNYEVKDPTNSSVSYLLNVCRPLNPVIGVNCHPGSSSCLVRKGQEPLSLGHPLVNPMVLSKSKVGLMYSYGGPCPQNKNYPLSSKIFFECNQTAGSGSPVFQLTTRDCQTQFVWETSLVCPPQERNENSCQIAFDAAKTNVDLKPLRALGPYKVPFKNNTFLVDVCGASVCKSSGVCIENDQTSFGLSSKAKLQWDYSTLLLTFYAGDPCTQALTGHRTTEIYFECDSSAGYGTPEVASMMSTLDCMAIFNWRTNLTCMESIYKPYIKPTILTTTSSPVSVITTTTTTSTVVPSNHERGVDESGHAWISVIVSAMVLTTVVGVLLFLFGRSNYGRRFLAHVKRSAARKGDHSYILDDHHINL